MNYELTIKDRLIILSVLPTENDILTLKICRDLKDKLGITEQEFKDIELKVDNGNYTWNTAKDVSKCFEIGEKANDIIVDSFKKLNKQKKITFEMMDTFEIFIKNID